MHVCVYRNIYIYIIVKVHSIVSCLCSHCRARGTRTDHKCRRGTVRTQRARAGLKYAPGRGRAPRGPARGRPGAVIRESFVNLAFRSSHNRPCAACFAAEPNVTTVKAVTPYHERAINAAGAAITHQPRA